MTVGLSMIVKDEPVDRIAMLVDFLRPVVSEFVIADTGSIDADKDIPLYQSWGVKTLAIEWRNDFAWARNNTLDYLTTDWVLHLDADELPTIDMMNSIRRVDESCDPQTMGWLYFTRNFWGGEHGIEVEAHWHCRLFRRSAGRWYKPLHEQVSLNGREEAFTRGTGVLPAANKDAYLIHSKPREQIAKSEALYNKMENG